MACFGSGELVSCLVCSLAPESRNRQQRWSQPEHSNRKRKSWVWLQTFRSETLVWPKAFKLEWLQTGLPGMHAITDHCRRHYARQTPLPSTKYLSQQAPKRILTRLRLNLS